MHPKLKILFVGIDPHKASHTAVITNCFCEVLGHVTFENKPSAFPLRLQEVKKHQRKSMYPVFGLENTTTSGRMLTVFLKSEKYSVNTSIQVIPHRKENEIP